MNNNNQTTQGKNTPGNNGKSSTGEAGDSSSYNKGNHKRGNNNRNRTKNNHKTKKKPNFVGTNDEKIKAVVADEPGLDPLSIQLEKLEKEILSHVRSTMSKTVATSIQTLKPYDFKKSPFFPKSVDPKVYTTIVDGKVEVDEIKKSLYEDILKSEISAYVKMSQQHQIHMQHVYGLFEGNIDESVTALAMADESYEEIQLEQDPIRFVKLLRKICRAEKGVDYAVASFHSCLSDLINCKQGNMTGVEYMKDIKLKYDVLTSQFGGDFLPTSIKNSVLLMHSNDEQWTGQTFMSCTEDEKERINRYTKDRLLAYIGVCGYGQKLSGGVTLKQHLNNNAAVNRNPSIAYPKDITALLKLTSAIMPQVGHQKNTNTGSSQHSTNRHNNNNDSSRSNNETNRRDGAQFTQTSTNNSQSADVGLHTAYHHYDDSDIYGSPVFVQTGTEWCSNITTIDEITTSYDDKSTTLQDRIEQLSLAQGRDRADTWCARVLAKLIDIGIHDANNIPKDAAVVNDRLRAVRARPLHPSTIHGLTCSRDLLPQGPTTQVRGTVQQAAAIVRPNNPKDWTHSVLYKIGVLNLVTNHDIRDHLSVINHLLPSHGLRALNTSTISAIQTAARKYSPSPDFPSESGEVEQAKGPTISHVPVESGEVGQPIGPIAVEAGHPDRGEVTSVFAVPDNDNTIKPKSTRLDDDSAVPYQYSPAVHTLLTQFPSCGRHINLQWILLDSGSTIHLFTNGALLRNIRKAANNTHITVNSTGGTSTTCYEGTLPGFGTVWYYPDGMANVLSLGLISKSLRVTMDTNIDNALMVHKQDGTTRRFSLSSTGLYRSDLNDQSGSVFTITTVKDEQMKHSALDVRRAKAARKLQTTIGHPSNKELIKIIESNLLDGCGTTRRDVMNAERIFGPSGAALKGKTTTPSSAHLREDSIPIPDFVTDNYREITISADIIYVNHIPFITTLSRHIYFTTVEAVYNAKASTLLRCIRSVIGQYTKRGLHVTKFIADSQFDCIADELGRSDSIEQVLLSKDEHEKFIERNNRFVKDRCRCMFSELPYKRIPKRMTIRLVYTAVFWINSFPRNEGISNTMSPRVMMTGIKTSIIHAKYKFGEYFQTHETSRNDMTPRTLDAIFTGPIGNAQGGFYALNLSTGEQIKRFKATLLPATQTIIDKVHQLADKEKAVEGLLFNKPGTIHDLEDTSNTEDDDASDGDYSNNTNLDDVSLEFDSDGEEDSDAEPEDNQQADASTNNNYFEPLADGQDDDDTTSEERDPNNNRQNEAEEVADPPTGMVSDDEASNADKSLDQVQDQDEHMDTIMEEKENHVDGPTPATSSRPRRAAGYIHPVTGERTTKFTRGWANAMSHYEHIHEIRKLTSGHANKHGLIDYIQKDNQQQDGLCSFVNHMLLTQYGIKRGLELFEQEGVDAVLKELRQMHNLQVIEPLHHEQVTKEMRQRALNYLMFLKRKKSGQVKGRGCADGRKQRLYVAKEDAAAPTVGTPALMISCLQDAVERRIVITLDVPGAFLQTNQPDDDEVIIRFEGPMVDSLITIDPALYKNKIQIVRNGKKILYARAKKAIYGTVRAAYLFWLDISSNFKEWGFEPNPYDQCTVNKMFGEHQCTIQWHVDDLKISCRNPKVLEMIIEKLNKRYGKVAPLTITRGDVHDYLGMTIDFSEKNRVMFTMYDYINDILDAVPPDMEGTSISPAGDHLFKINHNGVRLSESRKSIFHHHVAQLLFLSKRARPDLQTAVAFLCTRVHDPDEDDYKKLARVIKYLRQSSHLPLVLGSDGKGNIYWSVDAAFAVHSDMRGHTGAHMSMGQGTLVAISSKQKMNTRSSTEAELVGVDQPLPMILWSRLFSTAQGMQIDDNILYQDNESAIRMEKNGKASCTKRTKHIEIRYFYITDKIKSGEIHVEHCPTKEMIGDYFTKPLAGSLFKKFRNIILGIQDADMAKYRKEYNLSTAKRKAKERDILNKKVTSSG